MYLFSSLTAHSVALACTLCDHIMSVSSLGPICDYIVSSYSPSTYVALMLKSLSHICLTKVTAEMPNSNHGAFLVSNVSL